MAYGTPPTLNDNGWITIPWAEFVGKAGSHGATFSASYNGENQAVFNILVPWSGGVQAEQDILGIAIFSPETSSLSRTPPVQHPYLYQMYAEKILSATPMQWDGKNLVILPNYPGVGGNESAISSYTFWMLSIGFSVPKYNMLSDTALISEWGGLEFYRYCEADEEQHTETVTRQSGSFIWQAGPLSGQDFVAPTAQHFPSSIIKLTWRRVPRFGLLTNNGQGYLLNNNIRSAIGGVHNGATPLWGISDTAIGDQPANANANGSALRLIAAKQHMLSSPLAPIAQGLPWGNANTYHDVEFTFHYWNPPSGDSVNYGHNLAPEPAQDGKWYLVKSNSGALIYPNVLDLTQIFTLATQ